MLAILLSWFWVYSMIEQWLNQTLCIRYFTEFIQGTFGNWTVIKSDTLCELFYRVEPQLYHNCQNVCQHWCSIYWSLICYIINKWSSIWYHFMGILYYSIAVLQYLKEILFINICLKVYLSKIGIDVSENLCLKHEMLYFNDHRKEYILVILCQFHNINHKKI